MKRITMILLGAALAAASLASPERARAQACNCGLTGAWAAGTTSHDGWTTVAGYSVTVTGNSLSYQLTVSDNTGVLLQLTYTSSPSYYFVGVYRFVINYSAAGVEYSTMYDLSKPGAPVLMALSGSQLVPFQVSGKAVFLDYATIDAGTAIFHVLRADSLTDVYDYSVSDNYTGIIQPIWGPDDRTFYYYRNDPSGAEVTVVDMEFLSMVYQGSFAHFNGAMYSPCGDAIAFLDQPDLTNSSEYYELHDTQNGGTIGSQTIPQPGTLLTNTSQHYVEYSDQYGLHDVFLANNTGVAVCPVGPQLTSASVSPGDGVGGATFTVTASLSAPARYGINGSGEHVTVNASGPVYGAGSFSVPWRGMTGSVVLQASPVYGAPDTATITLSCNGSTQIVHYVVDPTPPKLSMLYFTPGAVDAGATTTLEAMLDIAALPGGATISLSNGSPSTITVPSSITVAQGQIYGGVDIATPALLTDKSVTVTGTYQGVTLQTTLQIVGPRPQSLTSPDACLVGGQPVHAALTLSPGLAPARYSVPVTGSDPASAAGLVLVPVDPGVTTAYFDIPTLPVSAPTSVTFTAALNGVAQQLTVTLQPAQAFYTNLVPLETGEGINNLGFVAGTFNVGGWLWKSGPLVQVPGTGWPSGNYGAAHAVNDSDVVVGDVSADAYRWDGHTFTNLTGGSGGSALAVNAAGKVAGWENTASGQRGFFYDGAMHALGTLGGAASGAAGVNASDVVVGWANSADGHTHAFRWTLLGGMQDLGLPPGTTDAWATAINTGGTVVGYAMAGYQYEACIWDAGGARLLDTGGLSGQAFALNDAGQVVGVSNNHPALWSGATRTLLDGLGGACGWDQYMVPAGINNHGQIVGTDQSESGNFAWMLTLGAPPSAAVPPAPEPVVRALGLAVLGANPVRGALALRCALPALGPAKLDLLDVSGRRIASRELPGDGAVQLVRVDETGSLAPGVYFARLVQAGHACLARVAVIR